MATRDRDTFIVQMTIEIDGHSDSEKAQDALIGALNRKGALPENVHFRAISAWRMFEEPTPHKVKLQPGMALINGREVPVTALEGQAVEIDGKVYLPK